MSLRHSGQAFDGVGRGQCEPRVDAITITKQASGTAKINPLMAAFNAIPWMAAKPLRLPRSIH